MNPIYVADDLHLRDSVPRCRSLTRQEWYDHQQERLHWLFSHDDGPVVIPGDIFHRAVTDPLIFTMFAEELRQRKMPVYYMPGNHDMVIHDHGLFRASTIGILPYLEANVLPMTEFCDHVPFGQTEVVGGRNSDFLCLHQLIFDSDAAIPPGVHGATAESILTRYPSYKYILTGDNHKHFVYEKDGRLLLNPGCFTIQDVEYKDVQPSIFKISDAGVEELPLPQNTDVIDDSYIVQKKEGVERRGVLVETLKNVEETSFNFEENVKTYIQVTPTLRPGAVKMAESMLEQVRR
jgi:DNA repair exonuclease SbcCD nuclease subunit